MSVLARLEAQTGTIHRVDGGVLRLVARVGVPDGLVPMIDVIPKGKGMAGLAWLRGAPVDSCDIQEDATGEVRPGALATGVRGALAVPMLDESGQIQGVLGVGTQVVRDWTEQQRQALLASADSLGRAMGREGSKPPA